MIGSGKEIAYISRFDLRRKMRTMLTNMNITKKNNNFALFWIPRYLRNCSICPYTNVSWNVSALTSWDLVNDN